MLTMERNKGNFHLERENTGIGKLNNLQDMTQTNDPLLERLNTEVSGDSTQSEWGVFDGIAEPVREFKNEYTIELRHLIAERDDAVQGLTERLIANQTISISDTKRWNYLINSMKTMSKYSPNLVSMESLKKSDWATKNQRVMLAQYLLHMGAVLKKYCIIREASKLIGKLGMTEESKEYFKLEELFQTGELMVEVNGVSYKDIMSPSSENPPTNAQQLQYFFEVAAAEPEWLAFNPEKLKENQSRLREFNKDRPEAVKYTKLTEKNAAIQSTFIRYLMAADVSDFDRIITRSSQKSQISQRESARSIKSALLHLNQLSESVQHILFNPDHPEFGEICAVVNEYLTDARVHDFIFELLGFKHNAQVINGYRAAKFIPPNHPHFEFYQNLAHCLESFISTRHRNSVLVTKSDLGDIITLDSMEEKSEDSEEVKERFHSTAQKFLTQKSKFTKPVDMSTTLAGVNWGPFIMPQFIDITTFNNKGEWIRTIFHYWNEDTQERLQISLVYKPNEKFFDWSVLEDIQDPEMKTIFASFVQVNQSVLESIMEAQLQTPAKEHSLPAKADKTHRRDEEVHAARIAIKEEKSNGKKAFTEDETDQDSNSNSGNFREDSCKIKPIAIDNEHLHEQLRKLSPSNQEIVKEAIERFNSRRSNLYPQFKKLKTLRSDGKVTFRLRVGNLRVLVTEDEDKDTYVITDAADRKDIYRG